MLKIVRAFNAGSHIKKFRTLSSETNSTLSLDNSYFTSNNEIMENVLGKFVVIGINLRENKNILTETALEKLNNSIKNFDNDDRIYTIVLHGCGGNFCSGIVESSAAEELSLNLLKTLNTVGKPIIAALDGHTIDFGLQLALMCDIRVIDKSTVVGFQNKSKNLKIPSFLYERLVATAGLSNAIELLCVRHSWTPAGCLTVGIVNKIVDAGCALGTAMNTAQNISFNNTLESIILHKSKILSFSRGKVS